MVMNRVKSLTTGRSLLAAVAIVSGLVVGTGQLTAASTQLEVGPASGGVDSMRVVGPGVEATVITADDHPQVFAGADKARDGLGFPVGPGIVSVAAFNLVRSSCGAPQESGGKVVGGGRSHQLSVFSRQLGGVSGIRFQGSGRRFSIIGFPDKMFPN